MSDPNSTGNIDPAQPFAGLSRETKIRRDAEGRWYNEGIRITHHGLSTAFDRWLTRADDGRYCLKNSINWAYVTIEGAPLFVRSLALANDGVDLHVSDQEHYRLDPSTLRVDAAGLVYCTIAERDMQAQFDTPALVALGEHLREDTSGTYLELAGQRHYLKTL